MHLLEIIYRHDVVVVVVVVVAIIVEFLLSTDHSIRNNESVVCVCVVGRKFIFYFLFCCLAFAVSRDQGIHWL